MAKLTRKQMMWLAGALLVVAVGVALYFIMTRKTENFASCSTVNTRKAVDGFVDLGGSTPDLVAQDGDLIVALFYADWCPHCVEFKPKFKAASSLLEGKTTTSGKKVRLVQVDCDAHSNLASQFNINGFPTVKLITSDSDDEYNGARDTKPLVQHVLSL